MSSASTTSTEPDFKKPEKFYPHLSYLKEPKQIPNTSNTKVRVNEMRTPNTATCSECNQQFEVAGSTGEYKRGTHGQKIYYVTAYTSEPDTTCPKRVQPSQPEPEPVKQ